MTAIRFIGALLLATAGCVSSNSVGYIDDDPSCLSEHFEHPPRVWCEERKITVELLQTRGPGKVALIDYRVEDGDVYLWPINISGRGGGTSLLTVDLRGETLPGDWKDHVYWLTEEHYYPIGHGAFWDRSVREPSHRTKIEFLPKSQ